MQQDLHNLMFKMKSVMEFASISLLIKKTNLQGSGPSGFHIKWQTGFKLKPTKAK